MISYAPKTLAPSIISEKEKSKIQVIRLNENEVLMIFFISQIIHSDALREPVVLELSQETESIAHKGKIILENK